MQRVFGIVGRSGSGKTTLIEAMMPWFNAQGLEVAVIKHSHHRLEFEPPHKDSARFRNAGAREVIVASPYHYALFHNLNQNDEPLLVDLVQRLQPVDVVLVEGYRQADIPRLEVYRPSRGVDPVYPHTEKVVAIATDTPLAMTDRICLDLNQPQDVAAFIWEQVRARCA
ncbi:molybdopterin-guanine dinucleotide biosynthesis protein B [Paenalcaligenes sp.]|uniref:molybdopterin-guanine dinucleotide biosynthesis protein B n=1 Tax=Paenalcaligenes sp. TaxID=1966342 RepID=UPI00261256F8|nr:molybdopterin-guanine dinucleotide biosynthesis protein B [Paenalcaligenes sp.]